MNKIIYFSIMVLIIAGLTMIFNQPVINEEISCPTGLEISYYYQPGCHACGITEPIIELMINNGCSVSKINLRDNPEAFVLNDVEVTPTLIINNNRLTGAFTIDKVKDLINNLI